MKKREFLARLRVRLSDLPRRDVEERLSFYSEMIDDRMEEGLSEEEAVSAIGSADSVASQIAVDAPLAKAAKEKAKPKRRLKAWVITLLALGSPIWLSLAVAAFAIIFSLYVSSWSVVISLWAAFASVACCAPAGVVAGTVFALTGDGLSGIAIIGAGVACAGLAILLFFGCRAATKGALLLTKGIASGIKNCFSKKEEA